MGSQGGGVPTRGGASFSPDKEIHRPESFRYRIDRAGPRDLRGPASKALRLYASQMNSGNSAPPKAASGTRGMPCRPVAFASR